MVAVERQPLVRHFSLVALELLVREMLEALALVGVLTHTVAVVEVRVQLAAILWLQINRVLEVELAA